MFGISVKQVSPAYTSQRCPSCGYTHENNRRSKHQFVCQKCEYELNADYNTSKNIARKLLKRLSRGKRLRVEACSQIEDLYYTTERCSGRTSCQCALKSGTLNLNDEYTASVDSAAEGESTDKPSSLELAEF